MGCDGGTIPRRDELVRVKKKPEQKDKEAELAFRWRHCTIKQLPLQRPIVACQLGRLYSKEAVIEGLLDRSTLTESAAHIKSLKDVKPLNLTENPAYDASKAANGDGYADGGKSPFICPVIGLEMNGKYKFCYLWTCGCVMSQRALKQVKTSVCHRCQAPFEPSDVIIINAEGDELKLMEDNMNERILEKKLLKNKKKKRECAALTSDQAGPAMASNEPNKEMPSKKLKIKKEERSFGPSTSRAEPQDPAFKRMKGDYSVAKDPKASEVLKSIFTSHKSAAEQTKAHWITYNPFYN